MRTYVKYIFFIYIHVYAQNAILEVDTNFLRIGEQFAATLNLYDVSPDSVDILDSVDVFQDFELINQSIWHAVQTETQEYLYKDFLLTSFDTGEFRLAPISKYDFFIMIYNIILIN